MTSFRAAFALSKDEVRNATPPGTTTLVGQYSFYVSITKLADEAKSISNGRHHSKTMMKSALSLSRLRIPQTP